MTGSFFAAMIDGISPDTTMMTTAPAISTSGCHQAICNSPEMPSVAPKMRLTGYCSMSARITPSMPEKIPKSMVSTLKMLDISLFLAPSERSMPISLVLSCTEMYMIMEMSNMVTSTATSATASIDPFVSLVRI